MRTDWSAFYNAIIKTLPARYLDALTNFDPNKCPGDDALRNILRSISDPNCSKKELEEATWRATNITSNSRHLQSPVRLKDALSCARLGILAGEFKPNGWCGERSMLAALELLEKNVYARTVEPCSHLPATVIHVSVEFLDSDGNINIMDPTIGQIIPVGIDIWYGSPEDLENMICDFLKNNPGFTNQYVRQKDYYALIEDASLEKYASAVFNNIYGYDRKPNYQYYLTDDKTVTAMDSISYKIDKLILQNKIHLLSKRDYNQ